VTWFDCAGPAVKSKYLAYMFQSKKIFSSKIEPLPHSFLAISRVGNKDDFSEGKENDINVNCYWIYVTLDGSSDRHAGDAHSATKHIP
jgi:hypothetical protein